jgi:glycosyltransferase involved in cell wall biosynthesis
VSDSRPLVSIVIPCYNYARYLSEAIESALGQTYSPVEVIVVDDGSTDDTQTVARSYPVRLLTQRNQGLSASTNNGIRASRGEYVTRLDADDVLCSTFVEETLAMLERNPDAPLAHTAAEFIGARTGEVPFIAFDPEALAQGAMVTCTSLFRRTAWETVGGLDEQMVLCEDWDLWLTFAERNMRGVMVPKILWSYRQHGASMVNRKILNPAGLRREYKLICQLQDRHAAIFAPKRLVRRLLVAPHRFLSGAIGLRTFARLYIFYAVMLTRAAAGRHTPRERTGSYFRPHNQPELRSYV